MTGRRSSIALCTLTAAIGACAAHPALHDDIVRANAALAERFNAGDYEAVAAAYADDAVLLGPGGYRVEGREAIDAYWVREWTNATWALEVHRVEGTPEMPIQRGRSTLEYDAADGGHRVSFVEFLLVWRLEDGVYRIVVDGYWDESRMSRVKDGQKQRPADSRRRVSPPLSHNADPFQPPPLPVISPAGGLPI